METIVFSMPESLVKFKEQTSMVLDAPSFSDSVNCIEYTMFHVSLGKQYMAWDISDNLLQNYSLCPLLARRATDGSLTAIMYTEPKNSLMYIMTVNLDVNELVDGFDVMLFDSVDNICNYINKVLVDTRNSDCDILETRDLSDVMVKFLN